MIKSMIRCIIPFTQTMKYQKGKVKNNTFKITSKNKMPKRNKPDQGDKRTIYGENQKTL